MIEKDKPPENQDKPVNQARAKFVTKQSMNGKINHEKNVQFEMAESKIYDWENVVEEHLPTTISGMGDDRLKTMTQDDGELKESIIL